MLTPLLYRLGRFVPVTPCGSSQSGLWSHSLSWVWPEASARRRTTTSEGNEWFAKHEISAKQKSAPPEKPEEHHEPAHTK